MTPLWLDQIPIPPAILPAGKERASHTCPACRAPLSDAWVSNFEPLCFAFFCAACFFMYGQLQGICGRD